MLQTLEKNNSQLHFAPRLYAAGLGSVGENSTGIMIRAIDPARESRVTTMLTHVRLGKIDLAPQQHAPELDFPIYGVALGAKLAKNLDTKPGDELIIVSQAADGSIANGLYYVTGILRPIDPLFDQSGVLMSIKSYQALMYLESGVHELAVQMDPTQNMLNVQQSIESQIRQWQTEHNDTSKTLVRNWRELMPAVSDMVEASRAATIFLGLIMVGLASMGMLNTTIMSIHERRHEFGILLSLGMGKYWLLTMVMIEAVYLSIVSGILGTAAGVAGGWWLQVRGIDLSGYMPDGFDYGGIIFEPIWRAQLNPDSISISLGLMFGISLLASLVPSWRTVRLKPVEVLR